MHYEIRPGYARPVERFEANEEARFAHVWSLVRHRRDAGCWKVTDDGARIGTWEPGELRQSKPGLTFCHCQECGKEFYERRLERLCIGCVIAVYPADSTPAIGEEREPRKYSRAWNQERLGVSGDRDE